MMKATALALLKTCPKLAVALSLTLLASTPLHADDRWGINEIRFGVLKHQIEDSPGEDGFDINAEILFDRIAGLTGNRFHDFLFAPRPDIGVSINTNGDTSQIYAGLTWDLKITDRVFFEASFGGAWHDGALDEDGETKFGCPVNFRESAGIGFVLSENWDMLIGVDHMSNAGLCSENRGLTNAGVKFGYKW